MKRELEKVYDPQSVEKRLYADWESKGYFNAEVDRTKKPFCIVIPPPNVTGQLHMGHALDEALQDILIRTKRMQGYSALWMPGTDHAGIATQIRVEEDLRKDGLTRYDLGREAFLEKVWEWKRHYGDRIITQLKSLGSSCDWRRERFTMDEGLSRAVREVFVNLYEKKLIYKGSRIINWCPNCTTALSDAEVEYEEKDGAFWHIKYPIKDMPGQYVTVATTRPETMLGDTAVAVNPEDERYTALVGKTLILPLVGREIPVIADDYVEKDFGTGCVKITPCHDPNDFEVGKRHDLPEILVLDNDAKIINGGKYNGMDRYEARKAIVKDLEDLGLLDHIEPTKHNVGVCYRCGTTVEPITSDQWFVKMGPMVGPAVDVVESGELKFVPDRFSKNYIRWMENLHDWCISRQLWWGHRIPAFYCDECGEMTVSREDITACPKCGGKVHQDPDVLDTWFSSALWPFSTLGWPDKTEELDYFYPTSVLVTGYDIITFWVSRMIFSGMEQMKQRPFDRVLIHGLVRDAQGRKMSKSLGNGIDPLEIIDKYGADALRFTLVTGNSPGNDMRFSSERVEASRNFCNKIWNAARFVLMNLDEDAAPGLPEKLELEDRWILSKYNTLVREVTANIESFELGVAAANLYDFVWDSFCDWYIELTKARLNDEADPGARRAAAQVLTYVLSGTMQLLHPFMPFLTEEIWQALPHEGESIMISPWPEYTDALHFPADEAEITAIMDAIRAIRNRRAEMNVPPSRRAKLLILAKNPQIFADGEGYITRLAYASQIELLTAAPESTEGMVIVVTDAATLYLPMSDLVDVEAELARLAKERAEAENGLARTRAKLANESFTAKAPQKVVDMERARAEKYESLLAQIAESVAALEKLKA